MYVEVRNQERKGDTQGTCRTKYALLTYLLACLLAYLLTYLLTYLITYSMVQSPSWEANWFAASQEIPRISLNPNVHYRTHKCPPPVSILGQPNPVHIPTSHLLEIHPNIHPSTPMSPHWSPSLRLFICNSLPLFLLPYSCRLSASLTSSNFPAANFLKSWSL